MNNIMCDLETLDTKESAAIISIGLVYFDLEQGKLGKELYIKLSINGLKEQIVNGRTLSLDTITWWMSQSDEVRDVWRQIPCDEDTYNDNHVVLYDVRTFFSETDKPFLWGNGVNFDNMILKSYFHTFQQAEPWRYSGDMCYRTIVNLFNNISDLRRIGEHHNALDDAKTQATHLINIYKKLKG